MSEFSAPALNSSNIVPPERLGSGTRDSTTVLHGDSVYRTASAGSLSANSVNLSHLAQAVRNEISAQSSLLSIWDGLDNPLDEGWLSNQTGKYDSTNLVWPVIGSAANVPANDRNNQLYQDNENVDWQRSFVFRWRQRFVKPDGANNENGALQVFWGGDEFTSASWLGGGVTEGLGFWIQRARLASNRILAANDNWLFFSLHAQNSSVGGSPSVFSTALKFVRNSASHVTLYNGALRPRTSSPYLRLAASGWANNADIGFFVPETDEFAEIRVQGLGEYVYLYVNETLYARINTSGLTNVTYGPRFGWLGDGGGTDGNRLLIYNAFVGTPDPINIVPRQYDGADLRDGTVTADKLADGAGGSFDLYEDVDTVASALNDSDRMVLADISVTGEPNRYTLLSSLKTFIRRSASDLRTLIGNATTSAAGLMSSSDKTKSNQYPLAGGIGNAGKAVVVDSGGTGFTIGDKIPSSSPPTISEWRRMSSGSAADLITARAYYTDITPDSSATWIYVSPLYESGDDHYRAANWGKVLYSDWSGGDAVSTSNGSNAGSSDSNAHEWVFAGAYGEDFQSSGISDKLHIGRTSTGTIAVMVVLITSSVDQPEIQGIRVFTE